MSCALDPKANVVKAMARVEQAAKRGARIICLPELFRSQYFCQSEDYDNFKLAEPVPGPTTEAMSRLAKKLRVVVIAPVFERRARGLYHNTAAILDANGRLLGTYRKMHIPDDPLYYEKFYFTPGDLGFRAWQTRHGNIGVLICWDQWYPEAARLTALQGAEILFYPTAIGWHPREKTEMVRISPTRHETLTDCKRRRKEADASPTTTFSPPHVGAYKACEESTRGAAQHDSWETIQRAHAIANGCFVAAVNRVGHERPAGGDGIEFWGQSFIAGPDGQIIAKASADREEIIIADCDLAQIEYQRTHWPFLRDRRLDAYGDITKRMAD
jgi:N-carbamoylputrescine amidase